MKVLAGLFVGGFILAVSFIIFLATKLYRAFVLSFLWLWFAVPLGAISLSYMQILGLLMVLRGIVAGHNYTSKEEREARKDTPGFLIELIGLTLLWAASWILHQFI